jgi:hypothetical protein
MHFYMHPYLHKKIYSCKKWVLHPATWHVAYYIALTMSGRRFWQLRMRVGTHAMLHYSPVHAGIAGHDKAVCPHIL